MLNRIVKYPNDFSHGPEGIEYLLPIDRAGMQALGSHFESVESDQVFARLRDSWQSSDSCAGTIATTFMTFSPRSFYRLPVEGDTQEWLLLDCERFVLFVPAVTERVNIQLPKQIHSCIEKFSGVRLSYNPHPDDDFLRPDSGFVDSSRLKLIEKSDDDYLWEDDESVIGGVHFFSTDCGNQFYCRPDGSIARWHMGNATISDAFPTCLDFAVAFNEYYTSSEILRDSQFFG